MFTHIATVVANNDVSGTILDAPSLNVQAGDLLVAITGLHTSAAVASVADVSGGHEHTMLDRASISNDNASQIGSHVVTVPDSALVLRQTLSAAAVARTFTVMQFRPGSGETVSLDAGPAAYNNSGVNLLHTGTIPDTTGDSAVAIGVHALWNVRTYDLHEILGVSVSGVTVNGRLATAYSILAAPASSVIYESHCLGGNDYSPSQIVVFKATAAVPVDEILISASGSSFEAIIEVASGATVAWEFGDGSVSSSLHPAISFGTAASRVHSLVVTPPAALLSLNVGYTHADGGSTEYPDLAPQGITGLSGLTAYTGLLRLFVAYADLPVLNISGLPVEVLEAYHAQIGSFVHAGCTAIKRLCIEACGLAGVLDLSELGASLEDLRAAVNALTGITWAAIYLALWHICIRDNPTLTTLVPSTGFPALREDYRWNCAQAGAYACDSLLLVDVQIYDNAYTSIALGAQPDLRYFRASRNAFAQASIDAILAICAAGGEWTGAILLEGDDAAAPSAAGLVSIATLVARSWAVTVNSGVPPFIPILPPADRIATVEAVNRIATVAAETRIVEVNMAKLKWDDKDPQGVKDYGINWAPLLLEGETILTSEWAPSSTDLEVETEGDHAPAIIGAVCACWLRGGVAGQSYTVVNHIVTSRGMVDDKTATIKIKQQ